MRICLNLKEIILKGTIMCSTMGQQTTKAKEVYSVSYGSFPHLRHTYYTETRNQSYLVEVPCFLLFTNSLNVHLS